MPKSKEKSKKKQNKSLARTLSIAFLAMSLIVLLVASFVELYLNFNIQRTVIIQKQELVAEDAADTVKDFISMKISLLKDAISFSDFTGSGLQEKELVLGKVLGRESSIRQIILLNEQRKETARVSRISKVLSSQLVQYDQEEMFFKFSQNEDYISSVYIDDITSEPMIVIAIPITDIFGYSKGTLLAEVNLKFMWDLVENIKIGEKGNVFVTDKSGQLIAFKDISRVLKGENLNYLEEVKEFSSGNEAGHIQDAEIEKGIEGKYVVTTHAHLFSPDWAVVTEIPTHEAYRGVFFAIGFSIIAVIIIGFLAVLVGNYLSKRITKPIIELRNIALEIGKGKLDKKIEIKAQNEIGELASAFNQMTINLRKSKVELEEYSRNLEKKVKERTSELQAKIEEIEQFHKMTMGREERIIELKEKVKKLEKQLKTTKKQA